MLKMAYFHAYWALFCIKVALVTDPCMGSGHILVYMFDVLMQIYLSYGYSTNEAVESIVRNNLWGMDIDDRAAQLAYFAVMMKAQQYDNRWLAKQLRRSAQPNVFALQDSPEIDGRLLPLLGDQRDVAERVLDAFRDAKEYGSIIQPNVTVEELNTLSERLDDVLRDSETQRADVQADAKALFDALWPQIRQCRALVQKYHSVVTNPPYMGSGNIGVKLSEYVKAAYPDSKSDLFAVFIERGNEMVVRNGYNCMVTMQSWMFLSSFEKLRERILKTMKITTLMHMENMVMHIAFGTAVTVFQNLHVRGYKGTYNQIKLQDIIDDGDERPNSFPVRGNRFAQVSTDNFAKIPGAPVAYWINLAVFSIFDHSKKSVRDYAFGEGKNVTTDNSRFIHYIWETRKDNIGSNRQKWRPCTLGGEYRKWFGNVLYVIDWSEEARTFYRKTPAGRIIREEFWNMCGVTWGKITSGLPNFRLLENETMYQETAILQRNIDDSYSMLALLNSKVANMFFALLNPTVNIQQADVSAIPIPDIDVDISNTIISISQQCVLLCRTDWDSFETSWDFQRHPLVLWGEKVRQTMQAGLDVLGPLAKGVVPPVLLALCYEGWKAECEDCFQKLKANEEELNRIFIDIYGLQDELTPEVEDRDVTVRRADLGRDIRSLISYAVGCMLGRYSLDAPGLAFAGGEWKPDVYRTYPADTDGILPITDDEYFDDDIVARFVEWVRAVYGADTLEDNLKFIADALGGKGTPRDVIRQYFLNDFYKDHLKVYQKRPIYWLFDSGKKNGFKCLIYMHRYQPDTLARIRTDYLHELQGRYRNAIETLERQIAGASTSERVKLQKRLTALKAQAEEARVYEEKLHHLADQMIRIDLDDGVKHNYTIFKDVLAAIK